MKTLIGLAGRSGTGKDYVALAMRQFGYEVYALADDVKLDLAISEGIPIEVQYGAREADIRQRQIDYAEAVRAEYGEDFWVRRLLYKLEQERIRRRASRVVIPDVRKQVEVDLIIEAGGVVYGVSAPDRVGSNGGNDEQLSYEDEIDELSGLAGIIDNSTMASASLEQQVRGLLGFETNDSLVSQPFRTGR